MNELFPNRIVTCDEKWIFMTTSDDQLSGWAEKELKALPKVKLAPKKGHGHYLVVCCQSDPLQLSESR